MFFFKPEISPLLANLLNIIREIRKRLFTPVDLFVRIHLLFILVFDPVFNESNNNKAAFHLTLETNFSL